MSEFDERRFGLITGSRCGVLFPKRSAEVGQDSYARELAMQLYFRHYDEQGTWQTEHGKDFEAEAYCYYRENFCPDAEHKPEFMCTEFHGGSADCLAPDHGVDFKCPTTLSKWLEYIHIGIDKDQYYQGQMYMFLYKRNMWRFAIYLTETHKMNDLGLTYPVPHDKRMIMVDVEKEDGWEDKLHLATPSLISKRNVYYEKLVEQFGPAAINKNH